MLGGFARSVTPRGVGVVFLCLMVATVVASSCLQGARAASPSLSARAGFVPIRGHVKPGVRGSGDLIYHGGPTMTTNKTYTIFWIPTGQSVSANYVSTINRFFQDVAHDSGLSTNVYASDTQYSSIQYSSAFGATFTDTAAFPANGCSPYGGASVCLTDSQLQSEIDKVIQAQGWSKA